MTVFDVQSIIRHFVCKGSFQRFRPYGNGHINDTYLLDFQQEDGSKEYYILQRINHYVFTKPLELMENIQAVTHYLRKQVRAAGGDAQREVLRLIPTIDGDFCVRIDDNYWRCVRFIDGCYTVEEGATPVDFYHSGLAFGRFQQQLTDFPSATLYETIPHFHDTPRRLENLNRAIEEDMVHRAAEVKAEISFARAHEADVAVITDGLKTGKLPLRVTITIPSSTMF